MRRTTEEQGHARAFTEYFPPRNKVEDFISQQHSRPYFAPFLQETPMKPSQLPDCLSHPPPRRMLPLQSPELCQKDRLGPRRHPPPTVLRTPPNIGPALDRFHRMPRGSPAYRHHQHHEPPGYFSSSQFAPVSPTKSSTFNRPASGSQSSFHQFMKDSINHSQSVDIRKDQGTVSKVTPSYSGIKNLTAQTKESNKAQSSDVSSPIPTVQLHRPPLTPSFYTSVVQEVCPVLLSGSEQKARDSQCPSSGYHLSPSAQSSDRSGGSSLPTMQNHVVTCQNQQHKRTPSSENVISVVVSSCSFQKRRKKFDDCGNGAKKLCLPGINSHTPKPTAGNSFSTSLLPQPSSRHALVLEPSAKPTENHLCIEPLSGQSTPLELSSISKPTQTKPCIRRPSTGAKQVFINSTQELIKLRPSNQDEEGLKKRREETHKKDTPSSLLSSEVSQKDTGNSPHVQLSSHNSGHSHRTLVKTLSRGNHMEESRKSYSTTCKLASKANSASLSCRTIEQNKTARPRRPVAIPNDIDDLFTPDPMTSAAPSCQKSAKPKVDGIKPATSERSCSASSVTSSSTSVKTGTSHSVDTQVSPFVSQPFLVLKPVKLEKLKAICSKDRELKNGPIKSTGKQLKDESVRSDEKPTFLLNNMRPHTLDAGTTTAKTHCSQPPLLERQVIEGCKKLVNEEDPLDVELDLDLSFDLDMDLSQISHSSEEEQLLSLQEIMECVTKPPDTPEKGAFSEPSRPGHRSCESKTTLPSTTKSVIYKNNLDQMLEEINNNKKVKEIEIQIQTAWKEDLLRLAEYEEAEENQEEAISTEQQEFLQRYSLMANAIREVPPGEAVFALEKFGRLFDQDTLQLRRCMVKPQGTAQKTLLWSSPAQLRLHLNIGLFQEAYDCSSPCPTQVTHFLFKMMSVHSERMVSENILQALCDIACTAAYQIVKNGSQQFKVWVPSLADVVLVLMNMGVAFVTLFPFENLQPPFTEGDLLEDIYTKNESPSTNKEQFPEHNCNNILKYLSYCMGLCPRAYSDDELLLLLTVVGRLGLDTWLVLQSNVELCSLQYKIVNNIRDWDTMLPRICLAITDLTDDHHNMCLLVQLLPDNTRGKQLRGHLSLSMISKLLDGHCSYRPTEKDFQLSDLRPYLPRMQPSTLLRGMLRSSSRSQKDKGEHMATLDQRAYYLCYSLLTLANEASKFQFFPAHQKTQLLYLCSELETHIKCDIRESEKCLYRSKVKDLVARIYTKWQMLLQRTRPLHGKLYDYWQPLPADTLTSSQEDQEMDSSDGVEVPDEEDEEEDTSQTEEVIIIPENKEEGDCITDDANKKGGDMEPEEMKGDNAMDDTKETEESAETVHEEWGLN